MLSTSLLYHPIVEVKFELFQAHTKMADAQHSATRQLDYQNATSLAISVKPYEDSSENVSAFSLPQATAEPVKFGAWVASVDAGASVNCPVRPLLIATAPSLHHQVHLSRFSPCARTEMAPIPSVLGMPCQAQSLLQTFL